MRDDFSPTNLGNAPVNYDPNAYNRIVKNIELLLNAMRQPGPINVTTITTSGNITIGGDLTVDGDAGIDGDLTVNGTINGGGGPWLPLAGGTMDSGAVINWGGGVTDKVHWFSNTYGTGMESSTLTHWSAGQHRWRTGGTSVSAGTERMLLGTTALTVNVPIYVPNAGPSSGILLGSGTNETRIGNQGIFAREGGTIIFRPNGSGSSSNQATLSTAGTLAAVLFSGSGASLTNLDASNLSSGTIPDARFPATLPATSGANLTNLNASNLSSGTVPSARVSGSYTGISGLGDLTATDLLVLKGNAIVGTGASGIMNGGIANLTSGGTGSLSVFAESGTIYFRPNGRTSGTNQATLDTNGVLALAAGSPALTISTSTSQTQIGSSGVYARNGGPVYLRPLGVGDSSVQAVFSTTGTFTFPSASLDTLTVTSNTQNLGVIGRSTSAAWSFRWNGSAGNVYVGGDGNNNFVIGSAANVSSNRLFYVGSTNVITYAELLINNGARLLGSILPGDTNPMLAAYYSASGHSPTIDYWREFTGGNPTTTVMRMRHGTPAGTEIGSISCNNTTTTYATTSDYRVKINYSEMGSVKERIEAIPVYRGEFVSDPGTVYDYFIAHEVQAEIPEAVVGEKDAVNDDGSPKLQGIDQSKIVPLHHGALKELYALIDSLTERVAELEAQLAGE